MIVLVYDITNFSSFESLFLWIEHISKYKEDPPFVAVFGNKCKFLHHTSLCLLHNFIFLADLEHKRVVRLDQTQNFVEEFQLYNFLVSAKTGENVNIFFLMILVVFKIGMF